jgi:chromosome segregation ATPase
MSSFIPITERRPQSQKYPVQFSIIVNPETARDQLIKKTNEYLADEELFTKVNKKKEKQLSKMDKEIDELNEKIRKISVSNYSLDQEIKKQIILRDRYQNEQTQMANYCNNLKEKYNNPENTIREYEEKIQSMKEENQKLLNQMDLKIENAEKLNKKIMSQIDEKIETYNNHKATLVGSEQRLNDIENEIENQRNVFKERAEINKLKFEELEKKYNNLEKKIMDLQMNSDIRKRQ